MGKTQLLIADNFGPSLQLPTRPAVAYFDGIGGGARLAGIKCMEYGLLQTGLCLFDFLEDVKHGVGFGIGTPSASTDPEIRYAENRTLIGELKPLQVIGDGKLDTQSNPNIDLGLDVANRLVIYQKTQVPWYCLRDALSFGTPTFHYLIRNLEESPEGERVRNELNYYASLSPREREYLLGPARKRLEAMFSCLQLQKRVSETFLPAEFFNAGGIYIASAFSQNQLSRTDAGLIMNLTIQRILELKRSGKIKRAMKLIIDEGLDMKLINGHVARALRQARNYDLEFYLVYHDRLDLPEDVRNVVDDQAKIKKLFRLENPLLSRFYGEVIGNRLLDLKKIKHISITRRNVIDGYTESDITSKNVSKDEHGGKREGETTSKRFEPRYREVQDTHETFYNVQELYAQAQQSLANQGVGQYHLIAPNYVSEKPETFKMLPMPYDGLYHPGPPRIPLAYHKFLEELRKQHEVNPCYRLSSVNYPEYKPDPSPPANQGSAATRLGAESNSPSTPSSTPTPPPNPNSSPPDSSPTPTGRGKSSGGRKRKGK